jgi:hypothetical protein
VPLVAWQCDASPALYRLQPAHLQGSLLSSKLLPCGPSGCPKPPRKSETGHLDFNPLNGKVAFLQSVAIRTSTISITACLSLGDSGFTPHAQSYTAGICSFKPTSIFTHSTSRREPWVPTERLTFYVGRPQSSTRGKRCATSKSIIYVSFNVFMSHDFIALCFSFS